MKRFGVCFLSLFCVFLLACQPAAKEVYTFMGQTPGGSMASDLSAVEDDGMAELDGYTRKDAQAEREFSFAGESLQLVYQQTVRPAYGPYEVDVYALQSDPDGFVYLRVDNAIPQTVSLPESVSVLFSADTSEKSLRAKAEELLSNYIDPGAYTYSCRSVQTVLTQTSRYKDTLDQYISASDAQAGENVINLIWELTFTRYINGCKTADVAQVRVDWHGELRGIRLYKTGAFEQYKDQAPDQKALSKQVKALLAASLKDNWSLSSAAVEEIEMNLWSGGSLRYVVKMQTEVSSASMGSLPRSRF